MYETKNITLNTAAANTENHLHNKLHLQIYFYYPYDSEREKEGKYNIMDKS